MSSYNVGDTDFHSYYRPSNKKLFAVALGDPPKLDVKALLQKTSNNWAVGHGEIKLLLTCKLHPHWLAFIVLKVSMHATRGKINQCYQAVIAMSYNKDYLGSPVHCFNRSVNVMAVTTYFLNGFKSCLIRWNCCLVPWTWPKPSIWIGHSP